MGTNKGIEMNENMNKPFGINDENENENEKENENKTRNAKYKLSSSLVFPYINRDGSIKMGLSVILEENQEMNVFGELENEEKSMLLYDSETEQLISGKIDFKRENLNKKTRAISEEVLTGLKNVRKKVLLLKSFKNQNLDVQNINDIDIHEDEFRILLREIKKTADLSKNIMTKIAESTGDDLEGMLSSYAFKKHLLITGNSGEGKTYIIDKFLKDNEISTIMDVGHTGIESIDLVGHYIKKPDGTFGWRDGTFSMAFRRAQKEKVAYFMDEILRIPTRELNILVGSLTPDSSGMLRLRTNRFVNEVDGVSQTEEIIVPQENLWVVGSTNQGQGYQSARIDEALKDRFRLFYQEMSEEDTHNIVEEKYKRLGGKSISAKAIVSLIGSTREIQETGNIPRSFSIRHLSEAIDTADNIGEVKKKMIELVNNIVAIDSDGKFNDSQVKLVTALIKKTI